MSVTDLTPLSHQQLKEQDVIELISKVLLKQNILQKKKKKLESTILIAILKIECGWELISRKAFQFDKIGWIETKIKSAIYFLFAN